MNFQIFWQLAISDLAWAAVLLTAVLAVIAGGWAFYHRLFPARDKSDRPSVDVANIVKTLQEGHRQQIEDAVQREEALRDQVCQLTDAVQALSDERNEPDAPAGIDEALALLAKGETDAAESVFQEVKQRRKAEGEESRKETAAAARHIGALAFLDDTDKALSAYREAVELDPENSDGWNQLGHLLRRTGDLEGAEGAYSHVLSLGNQFDDKKLIAVATGNLGVVYRICGDLDRAEERFKKSLALNEELGLKEGMANQYGNLGNVYLTRSDLDRAEEMYRKGLEIDEALGRKEGMARKYGNFGLVYQRRGDLDRAEEMFRKSLALDEEHGLKEGMANQYGNLGTLYKTRGDLERAEAMYKKGLELFQQVGAAPQIEKVERLLAELRGSKE